MNQRARLVKTLRAICDELEQDAFLTAPDQRACAAMLAAPESIKRYRSAGYHARLRNEPKEMCPFERPGTRKPVEGHGMTWVNPVPYQCWIDGWEVADRGEKLEQGT